jgi:hypothetical protein
VRAAEVVSATTSAALQSLMESALRQEPLHALIEDVQPVRLSDSRVSRALSLPDAAALLVRLCRAGPKGDYLRRFRYGRGQRVNAVRLSESSLEPEIESNLLADLIAHR